MSNQAQTSSTAVATTTKKEPGFFGRHKKKFMIGTGITLGAGIGYFLVTKTNLVDVLTSKTEMPSA